MKRKIFIYGHSMGGKSKNFEIAFVLSKVEVKLPKQL